MHGLAMRLLSRLDERITPTKPSPVVASTAAGTPNMNSSKKMNTSPAMKVFLDPGSCTGKKPATMASDMPASTCSCVLRFKAATSIKAYAIAAEPSTTTVHQ
jgi:hypothetical protein